MASPPCLSFPGDQGETVGIPGIPGAKGERGDPGFPGNVAPDCLLQESKILEIKQVSIAQFGIFVIYKCKYFSPLLEVRFEESGIQVVHKSGW